MNVTDETAAKFAGNMLCAVVCRVNRPIAVDDLAALLRVGGCDISDEEFKQYLQNGSWVSRSEPFEMLPTSRALNAGYLDQELVPSGAIIAGEPHYNRFVTATPMGACHFITDILGGDRR